MYKVYWTERVTHQDVADVIVRDEVHAKSIDDLTVMLKFCESLRKARRDGAPISFITSVSENPDVVGESGAADVNEDYSWTKRRGGRDREQKTGKPAL